MAQGFFTTPEKKCSRYQRIVWFKIGWLREHISCFTYFFLDYSISPSESSAKFSFFSSLFSGKCSSVIRHTLQASRLLYRLSGLIYCNFSPCCWHYKGFLFACHLQLWKSSDNSSIIKLIQGDRCWHITYCTRLKGR